GIRLRKQSHQCPQIVSSLLQPLREGVEQFGIGRLQRPWGRRRIIRIKPRQIEGIRWRDERLHHEFLPNVIDDRTGELKVAGDLTTDRLTAVLASTNAAATG